MYCTTDHVSSYLIRRQIQLIYVGIGMLCRAYRILIRGVVPGGAGCALAYPDFARPVNPISTRETDYAHLITISTPRLLQIS